MTLLDHPLLNTFFLAALCATLPCIREGFVSPSKVSHRFFNFPLWGVLDLYHAMRDRTLFFELVGGESMDAKEKLVVLNTQEDCIFNAAAWFVKDTAFLDTLRHETKELITSRLVSRHVPTFEVKGRPNDFLKRGVWLTSDHAWAVVGLTEYKEKVGDSENQVHGGEL
jgi:hypothetical protein